jgi:hypothetical protein
MSFLKERYFLTLGDCNIEGTVYRVINGTTVHYTTSMDGSWIDITEGKSNDNLLMFFIRTNSPENCISDGRYYKEIKKEAMALLWL